MNDPEKNDGRPPIELLDMNRSMAELRKELAALEQRRAALPADAPQTERARLDLEIAETLLGMLRAKEAWDLARPAFDVFVANELWQEAAEAADLLYRTDQPGSIAALGNGIWLAVTWPIRPETTVTLLHHIVEETPDDSDGAAVAAAAAHYIADLRTEGKEHENLTFLTGQVLGQVARRHRGIEDPELVKTWMEVLELNDPDVLLPRLARILDVIVGDDWWYDRDAIRAKLPVN
ncbi:MAG: hypothetical protein D6721_02705 [Gammaproteobacteria bacterium]|nr:MAG: hypothetical protein D6721_02705 [Gammaproteobacteria bacterium]